MPNEEPKGPTLPPKKKAEANENTVDNLLGGVKSGKYIEIKGAIGALSGISVMLSYLIYNYYFYNYNVELNEMYFTSSVFGIFILNGLLFTFFQNRIVKTILLFTSVFHFMLGLIYVIIWIIYSEPYTNIKFSLFIGLGIGLIYFIYDTIANNPGSRNNNNTILD